jgi:hypothetical protein
MDVTQSGIYNFWSMFHQDSSQIIQEVANDRLISAINQTAEQVSINASKISLEGLVTVNGKFTIDQYGSMTATGGTIANFTINNTAIYNGTNSMQSTTQGVYIGTDGIRQYNSANAYINMQNGVLTANGVNLEGSFTMTSGSIDITADSSDYNIIKIYSGDPNGLHYFGYMNTGFGAQQSRPASSSSVSRFFNATLNSEAVEVSETINGELSGWRTRITSREISNSNNTSLATNDSMYFTINSTNGYYLRTRGGDTLFSATRQGIMENGTLLANKYYSKSGMQFVRVSYTPTSANTWLHIGNINELFTLDSNSVYMIFVSGGAANYAVYTTGLHIQSLSGSYNTFGVYAHIEGDSSLSYYSLTASTTWIGASDYVGAIYAKFTSASSAVVTIDITAIKIS